MSKVHSPLDHKIRRGVIYCTSYISHPAYRKTKHVFLGGLYSVLRAHKKKTIKRDAINVESPASYAKELNYITSFTPRSARGIGG